MEAGHRSSQQGLDVGGQVLAPGRQRAARAFGLAGGDLDIRLDDADRPAVVTRVLASCLDTFTDRAAAERAVWEWTLAERLQGLIAVVLAGGVTTSPWRTRCAHCSVAIEIDVPLHAFVAPPGNPSIACRSPDGHAVTARLPRGSDARAWRAHMGDPEAFASLLVEDIDGETPAQDWRMPSAWRGSFADALAEADPLTVLQLQAACPGCDQSNVIDFDIEGCLLGLLAGEQQRLIDDVHRLACAYHWSEAAIAALPPWRRRAYLARIEQETAA